MTPSRTAPTPALAKALTALAALAALAALTALAACGEDGPDLPDAPDVDPRGVAQDGLDRLEAEVVDRLQCSGYARAETRDLIRAAIDQGSLDPDDAAAAAPELAALVGSLAVTTDATALLVANVVAVVSQDPVRGLLSGGWADAACGAAEPVACQDALGGTSQGTTTLTVDCDGEGNATAAAIAYAGGCRLAGSENSGAVSVDRATGALSFDAFTLGSVRRVDGDLSVTLDGGEVTRVAVAPDRPLSVTTDVGRSCEVTMTYRVLALEQDGAGGTTTVALDVERATADSSVRVRTGEAGATWASPPTCTCPVAGSAFEVILGRPFGAPADASFRVDFAEDSLAADAACTATRVGLTDWPEGCDAAGLPDCGRATVEATLGSMLSVGCTPL